MGLMCGFALTYWMLFIGTFISTVGVLMFPDIHIREFLSMPFNGLKNKNVSCMDFLLKYSAFDLKGGHCNVLPIINLIKPSVSYCCILTVSGTLFLFCK